MTTAHLHEQTKAQLHTVIQRIENLESEKVAIAEDISEIYKEAKGNGFDVKAIRKIIALRKKEESDRLEEEAILATYMAAIGMVPGSMPLFESAGHPSDTPKTPLEQAIAERTPNSSDDLNDEIQRELENSGIRVERAA